ncbi:hypothetical protein RRG08_065606 [Elysia crispata]|uniref:Uncharacterized protein n=1 Tax=Elysia crispata TaxID=231223 RepID=A0AAE1D1N9_9GAST|nr:hypothetical protein RRG08_065606 [Elysia crispata]
MKCHVMSVFVAATSSVDVVTIFIARYEMSCDEGLHGVNSCVDLVHVTIFIARYECHVMKVFMAATGSVDLVTIFLARYECHVMRVFMAATGSVDLVTIFLAHDERH